MEMSGKLHAPTYFPPGKKHLAHNG